MFHPEARHVIFQHIQRRQAIMEIPTSAVQIQSQRRQAVSNGRGSARESLFFILDSSEGLPASSPSLFTFIH